jgi:hypothetical protein
MATKTENNTSSTVKKDIVENLTQTPESKDKDQNMADSPLHKLFVDALKDIYYAENAIVDALEKMEAATTEELKDAFEDHQLQTKKHISRLEKVFKLIGEQAEKKNVKLL